MPENVLQALKSHYPQQLADPATQPCSFYTLHWSTDVKCIYAVVLWVNNVANYALLCCNIFVVKFGVSIFWTNIISDLGRPKTTKTNPKDNSLAYKKAFKHIVEFLLIIWKDCSFGKFASLCMDWNADTILVYQFQLFQSTFCHFLRWAIWAK